MDTARTANKLLLQLKDMELPLEQDGKRINCTLGEGYFGLINGAWETVLHFKDWNVIQVFYIFCNSCSVLLYTTSIEKNI